MRHTEWKIWILTFSLFLLHQPFWVCAFFFNVSFNVPIFIQFGWKLICGCIGFCSMYNLLKMITAHSQDINNGKTTAVSVSIQQTMAHQQKKTTSKWINNDIGDTFNRQILNRKQIQTFTSNKRCVFKRLLKSLYSYSQSCRIQKRCDALFLFWLILFTIDIFNWYQRSAWIFFDNINYLLNLNKKPIFNKNQYQNRYAKWLFDQWHYLLIYNFSIKYNSFDKFLMVNGTNRS